MTMKFEFKGKIKKADFEAKLFETFGHNREISASKFVEEGKTLTLYYVDNGHAGTWMSGQAWIYTKETVEKHIKSAKVLPS